MTGKSKRLGIMGGTFDPIHYGHLVTAEGARYTFGLDQVLFLPSGRPPHKRDAQVSDAEHRYMMTVLATLTNPYFEVSRLEIDRGGISYTIDTLRALREQLVTPSIHCVLSGSSWVLKRSCFSLLEPTPFLTSPAGRTPMSAWPSPISWRPRARVFPWKTSPSPRGSGWRGTKSVFICCRSRPWPFLQPRFGRG